MSSIMRWIIGKIGLIWGALVFVFSWLWVWPLLQLSRIIKDKNKYYKANFTIIKWWGHFILFFLGVCRKVNQKELNAKDDLVIYVCNHRSQIDIPVNFTSTPQFVILSKVEATKIPVVGTALRLGHVLVDRKNKRSRVEAIEEMKMHLENGRSFLIYPEGRRARNDLKLGDFQDGAFHLAIEFQIPIVPITLKHTEKINNPDNAYAIYPGRVEIFFDEAVPTKGKSNYDIVELKEVVRNKMLKHLT